MCACAAHSVCVISAAATAPDRIRPGERGGILRCAVPPDMFPELLHIFQWLAGYIPSRLGGTGSLAEASAKGIADSPEWPSETQQQSAHAVFWEGPQSVVRGSVAAIPWRSCKSFITFRCKRSKPRRTSFWTSANGGGGRSDCSCGALQSNAKWSVTPCGSPCRKR